MFPITGENLWPFIPQKPPFVFIHSLLSVEDDRCITSLVVEAGNVLSDNNRLSTAGLLENMAQSAGCKIGFEDFQKGKTHTAAFIGEVRDFSFSRLPATGEELTTEIKIEHKVFGTVTVMSGRVMVKGEEIASCKMKVFFQPEEGA